MLGGKRIKDAFEGAWAKHATSIDWFVLGAGWVGAWLLFVFHEPPGWAVGALAAVAAIMTFSKPTALQRSAVVALAGFLFFLETRSITEDRAAQEKTSASTLAVILKDNRDKTKLILDSANSQFAATETGLSSVSGTVQQAAKLSESNLRATGKALDTINGAGNYIYVEPIKRENAKFVALRVWNIGKYPLQMVNSTIRPYIKMPDMRVGTGVTMGAMQANSYANMIGDVAFIDEKNEPQALWILTTAQNLFFSEKLEFRAVGAKFEYKITLNNVTLPAISNDPDDPHFHGSIVFSRNWTPLSE